MAQARNDKQGSSGVCLNKSLDVRHFSSFKTSLTVTLLIQLPDSGAPWRRCQPGSSIYVCQKGETIPLETLNSSPLVIKVNQYQVCARLVTFEPSLFRFHPGSPNVLTAHRMTLFKNKSYDVTSLSGPSCNLRMKARVPASSNRSRMTHPVYLSDVIFPSFLLIACSLSQWSLCYVLRIPASSESWWFLPLPFRGFLPWLYFGEQAIFSRFPLESYLLIKVTFPGNPNKDVSCHPIS